MEVHHWKHISKYIWLDSGAARATTMKCTRVYQRDGKESERPFVSFSRRCFKVTGSSKGCCNLNWQSTWSWLYDYNARCQESNQYSQPRWCGQKSLHYYWYYGAWQAGCWPLILGFSWTHRDAHHLWTTHGVALVMQSVVPGGWRIWQVSHLVVWPHGGKHSWGGIRIEEAASFTIAKCS